MITISVLGLDQYVVGHYSKDHTKNIASLFEVGDEKVSFYAPNAYMFHEGVEQTSWDTIVRVHAPCKFRIFEDKVSKYLIQTLKEFTINLAIEFYYYEDENRHEYINTEYPRFLSEDNVVNVEEESLEEGEELCEENMFKDFEEKLGEKECSCTHHHKH